MAEETMGLGTAEDVLDSMIGPPDTGSETAEEPAQETATSTGDSDGEAAAVEPEQEQEASAEQQEQEPTREELIDRLAKEHGLNKNDPLHSKLIEKLLTNERHLAAADKRNADKDTYIQQLKEQAANGFLTEWEKQLETQPEKPLQQSVQDVRTRETPGTASGYATGIQWNDGFDSWKNTAEGTKHVAELYAKAQEGTATAADVDRAETALMARRIHEHVLPGLRDSISEFVYRAINDLKSRDLRPVLEERRQAEALHSDEQARVFAVAELRKNAAVNQWFDEMLKPDGGTIKNSEGEDIPSNPMRKIIAEHQYILDIQKHDPNPRTAAIKTWLARYRAALAIYTSQKQNGIPLEKAGKLFKAGAQQAQEQVARDKVRQNLNQGSGTGTRRPMSDSDKFLAELSSAKGYVGLPASSLSRGLK
jgi:hypothetical protein